MQEIFKNKKRFIKIGWGDRKMFLETKTWKDLKIKDFIFAFFGLNEYVLKVEFLEEIPKNAKLIKINRQQLEVIKNHIKNSFQNKIIKKQDNQTKFF